MATESTADAGHAAAEIGACVNDAGGAIGMPQLCVDWMPNQIFWLVVTLAVIYLVLSRIALPRIGGVLAERKGTITNDLTAAEELNEPGEAIDAVIVFAPIRPVSLTPLPVKFATPATAFIATVPSIATDVAPLAARVTSPV